MARWWWEWRSLQCGFATAQGLLQSAEVSGSTSPTETAKLHELIHDRFARVAGNIRSQTTNINEQNNSQNNTVSKWVHWCGEFEDDVFRTALLMAAWPLPTQRQHLVHADLFNSKKLLAGSRIGSECDIPQCRTTRLPPMPHSALLLFDHGALCSSSLGCRRSFLGDHLQHIFNLGDQRIT